MTDFVKAKYGKIDVNKLTKPVLKLAIDKENKRRQYLRKRVKKLEKKLLPIEDESEERFRREKAYSDAYIELEEFDDDPYYTLEQLGISPTRGNELLAGLSKHINVNPKYGMKLIYEAYQEHYDTGRKCVQCGRTIPPTSKNGRNKKYCSDTCRQKAYRWRNKRR